MYDGNGKGKIPNIAFVSFNVEPGGSQHGLLIFLHHPYSPKCLECIPDRKGEDVDHGDEIPKKRGSWIHWEEGEGNGEQEPEYNENSPKNPFAAERIAKGEKQGKGETIGIR